MVETKVVKIDWFRFANGDRLDEVNPIAELKLLRFILAVRYLLFSWLTQCDCAGR